MNARYVVDESSSRLLCRCRLTLAVCVNGSRAFEALSINCPKLTTSRTLFYRDFALIAMQNSSQLALITLLFSCRRTRHAQRFTRSALAWVQTPVNA
jgi:hypothetical protein